MRGRVSTDSEFGMDRFFKDFLVGCGALTLIAVAVFVVLPLLVISFKIVLWIAVPIAALILIVVAVALFGRLVSRGRKHW